MLPGVWPGGWRPSSPPSTGRTSPSATGVSRAGVGVTNANNRPRDGRLTASPRLTWTRAMSAGCISTSTPSLASSRTPPTGSGQASVDEGQTIFEDHIPASAQELDLVDAGGDLHDRQTPGAELRDARTVRIERDALAGLDQAPQAMT